MSKHSRTLSKLGPGRQRKTRTNRGRGKSRFLSLEPLEGRTLMDASSAGILYLDGTDRSDHFVVNEQGNLLVVEKTVGGEINRSYYSRRDIHQIQFHGFDGNDYFENNSSLSSYAYGGAGGDKLIGGSGNDHLFGGCDPAWAWDGGTDGVDIIDGRGGNDVIDGGDYNDELRGGDGEDDIEGGEGDDTIYGGSDIEGKGDDGDVIHGGSGNDTIYGGGGNDEIDGEEDNDIIFGGTGDDVLDGGRGTDELYGEIGRDTLNGYPGLTIPDHTGDFMDWGPLPLLRFKQTEVEVDEGKVAKVTIERVPRDADVMPTQVDVQIKFITTNVSDFKSPGGLGWDNANGDVLFEGGQTETTLAWALKADGVVEKDEQFMVKLTEVGRWKLLPAYGVIAPAADTVTIIVHDENHAPVARNDGPVSVAAGKTVTIPVLSNDQDPDGDPISIVRTSQGKVSPEGRSIIYTAPKTTGPTEFSYTIQDSRGATATATVDVLVTNLAPIAIDDGDIRVAVGKTVTIDVLANDDDPDRQKIVITGTSDSRAKVTEDRKSIVFTAPSKTNDDYQFSYTIRDIVGATATATVHVELTNAAPVANTDTDATRRDVSAEIAVLDNDYDPDGHTREVVKFTQGQHGRVRDLGRGVLQYTPDINYFEYGKTYWDNFTYTISDGYGKEATAMVKVQIRPNGEPEPEDDSAIVQFNKSVKIDVLFSDSDPDKDRLTISGISKPAHGKAEKKVTNGKEVIVYTPTTGSTKDDTFTYSVSDGHGGSAKAKVTIEVNRPPVARPDKTSTAHNQTINIPVLINDSDPDGDPLRLADCTKASARGGAVSLEGSLVVYTPPKNFVGTDQLQYTISDGRHGESTTVVDIRVTNARPVANTDSVSTKRDEAVEIPVLRNDTDPDGDDLSVKSFDHQTEHGTVSRKGPNRPNVLIYTPSPGFTGSDHFTYTVDDGLGGTKTGSVDVMVQNRGPVARVDEVTAIAGQSIEVPVLANDTDPDGDTLSVQSFTTASANGGEVKRKGPNRPNVLIYTPRAGFLGTDQLQYTISDGRGGTATTVVNIVVKPAATNKGSGSKAASTISASLTDQVLAMTADWQPSGFELDTAISLIS